MKKQLDELLKDALTPMNEPSFLLNQKILNQGKLTILQLAYQEKIDAGYLGRLIRLTCLAPDIVKRILNGTQPPSIYLQRLIREEIPTSFFLYKQVLILGSLVSLMP